MPASQAPCCPDVHHDRGYSASSHAHLHSVHRHCCIVKCRLLPALSIPPGVGQPCMLLSAYGSVAAWMMPTHATCACRWLPTHVEVHHDIHAEWYWGMDSSHPFNRHPDTDVLEVGQFDSMTNCLHEVQAVPANGCTAAAVGLHPAVLPDGLSAFG